MDLSPALTQSAVPDSRMLPHLSPSFNHHLQQQPQLKPASSAGDVEGQFASRCSSGRSSSGRIGLEGNSDFTPEKGTPLTLSYNGGMEAHSEGGLGKSFQAKSEDLERCCSLSSEVPKSTPVASRAQTHSRQSSTVNCRAEPSRRDEDDEEEEMKGEEEEEEEDPVGCETCGEDFSTMQAYVTHSCASSVTSVGPAERVESKKYLGNDTGLNDVTRVARGTKDDREDSHFVTHDAENFVGKIVYNPDGSAYVIEGGDSDDSDLELLDVPRLEGSFVDRNGLEALSSAPPIPQIASAVFVSRSASAWCKTMNSVFSPTYRTPSEGAPVMHSFRVYNIRNPHDGKNGGWSDVNKLQIAHFPAKPILMCFMCKLSFGLPSSFVLHAGEEHGLQLNDQERTLLASPLTSAILQVVGKEKSPLISFLEPLPTSAQSGVPAAVASAPLSSFFLAAATGSSGLKMAGAATKVKYMYTSPRMSKDVISGNQEPAQDDGSSRPTSAEPWPARGNDSSVGSFREDQENGADSGDVAAPAVKMEWLDSRGEGAAALSSRTPHSSPSSDVSIKQEPSLSLNFSSPHDLSPQDYLPPSSTPVSMFTNSQLSLLAGGTCDEHPMGRAQGTECPKCDMILSSGQSLGGHMTMMHSRNSCKTLKCPKCNWHYKYQETLEIHMKEKHPDNDAQCIYCLTNQPHPRLARGETYSCGYKPYRCEVCNYSTTTKGNLSIHMQSDKHMNNMQELANGSSDMTVTSTPSHSQGQSKTFAAAAAEDPLKKMKPKQAWKCDVCNYETLVARNLRIHMTSEKHTHNMMVLQQNMKHMQHDMQLQMGQLMLMGQQDPMFALSPATLPPGMFSYDQSMLVPGAPPLFDLSVNLGRENGCLGGEEVGGGETSDAAMLYQCTICELHATDSLESLHQHLNIDRTKQRESENISVQNGTYTCHMCQYKTNLKANFQLHCKTDKHLQKLQMTNHIREGGPANEWRLGYLSASNPTQVRCNACNFYTSSVHKLQLHVTQMSHENNAHVFRLLQLAQARLQSASVAAVSRYYYRCLLCSCNARTKQAMLRHTMSIKHIQQAQAKQLTLDPRELFLAVLLRDGENVVFEETDGDRGRNSGSPDGNSDTPSASDKLDFLAEPPTIPNPSTTTTSAAISNSSNKTSNNTATSLNSKAETRPVTIEKNPSPSAYDETETPSPENHSKRSQTPGSRADTERKGSLVLCPLCQDECQGLACLEGHLAKAHNVTPEGMQKLLNMVEIPSIAHPDYHAADSQDAYLHDTKTGSQQLSVADTSSAAMTSSSMTLGETVELDVEKMEEEHDQMVADSCVKENNSPSPNDKPEADEYRCQICTRTFANIDHLYAHQNELGHLELKQTPRGPGYLCWKKGCNQYFKTAQTLQIHFREIHAKRNDAQDGEKVSQTFKCRQCSVVFRDAQSLESHLLYHLAKAITQCSICSSCFTSVQAHKTHLEKDHEDLATVELEALQNAIDTNIAALSSSPGCESFLANFLGCKLPRSPSDSSVHSASLELGAVNMVEKTTASGKNKQKGVDALAADIAKKVEEKNKILEMAQQQEEEDDDEQLEKKFPDQQSLEDFINSQAVAVGNYEDLSRKFRCHRCKVGFTKQSYLTAHNKTQQHRQGRSTCTFSSERYNDPSRPYKCEICKESFTQKNILLVHFNSVSHLHTANKVACLGVLPLSMTSTLSDLSPSSSPCTANSNGTSSDNSSASSKKSYKCNICNTAYSQSTNLEIHMRSVAHQTRVAKLHELVITGQINHSQPLFEQPDMAMDAAQMHLFMEMMQQQQQLNAVSSQSLMFQALPSLNSFSLLQGMPPLFTTAATTSLFSPSTAALASYASASAMETEHINQMLQSSEKASKQNENKSEESEKVESDGLTAKCDVAVKTEPDDDFMEFNTFDIGTDTLNVSQVGLKSEMSTNTVEACIPGMAKSSDQPSNPILAASIPVMIARPRGFMGRFKPQIHRNLLENIGFECVMQFNEYTQHKKKVKEKVKDKDARKEGDETEDKENLDRTEPTDLTDKTEREEADKTKLVDLPEINKSRCLHCSREFSSVFVLKAHEEEVHKRVVPLNIVEDFGEKFKEDFEKKLPRSETESLIPIITTQTASQTSTTTASTNASSATTVDKISAKASKEEMPPPPPPPPQLPTPYDMAQMMPMLSMMPMTMPMNLMSIGMQSQLVSMMPGTGLDMSSSFPLNLGIMDSSLMTAQQQMQQAATAANNQKRVRTRISDEQLKILRAHFDINNSPTEAQINQMSEQSGLPQKVIKHWFRNTLFKERQRNKDSPYNFNNPPSTTIDLEEYEKTGKIPATVVKVEPCDDEEDIQSIKQEEPEPELRQELQTQPSFQTDLLPRSDMDDRREYESRSNTSTPSNLSSIPSTPTCSAPPTPTPISTTASILDAHAVALAREAAAAQNALNKRANRTRFTDYQVKILQEYFEQNAYPKDDELDHLSKVLSLSPRVIVVWFQNARQKARKIYENQPAVETKETGTPFQRTPSLNYLCKKCGAVFQRYYELIKHQKRPCLSENNNNKPLASITDDDSLSSGTSLDDSGLSDSLSLSASSQKDGASPASLGNAFRCDKCSASFNRIDLWQEHQKVHNLNTGLFPPFSSKSAFGMLQSLAQQEDSKALVVTTSSLPSASTSSPVSLTAGNISPNKRKLEPLEDDRNDDQPRDKRLRTTILPEQLDYLYQKYQLDCNPSRKQLETIAQEVGLKKRVVQVWFQNTRARERKGQYRAHQQLIHKRCPFCRALFRAKSALESHLATKHPEEMAKGEINIDAIPDAAMEPPQPAHSMPSTSTAHQASTGSATDLSKLLSPNNMQPYLSFMPPTNLTLGFPPMTSDPIQLSMQHLYEDAYKKYISELSGNAHHLPAPKSSYITEPLTSTSNRHIKPAEKRVPLPLSAAGDDDDDAPLDLSVSVKSSSDNKPSSQTSNEKNSNSCQSDRSGNPSNMECSLNLSINSSFNVSSNGPQTPSSSFIEKANREFERNRHNSYEDSYSETHSEFNDSEYQGEIGSRPSSPKTNSSGSGPMQKRYRTQMTSLQVKVMKLLFVDYKTPTMAECELLGREIGLPKRVVQVWFQNARAKEKKSKLTMSKSLGTDVDFPKTPEECALCNFKYSHKFTVQDHIFTKRHIDNAKAYIQTQSDAEREISDPAAVSGLLRQQSHEMDRKLWEKNSTTSSQQLAQLQQGLNAAAFGLTSGLSGVGSPFTLGSVPLVSEISSSKKSQHKESHGDRDKKSDASAATTTTTSTGSKDHHQQFLQHQPTPQQATELAQMMALGGYLPGLDPSSYLSYMYTGLPGFFPGMTAMPLLQPGLLPGAEHMLAYDPLSFGTPLPLLQIPAQAIKSVSEKVQDSSCTLAHYTQDCKTLGDLKGLLSSLDAACFVDSAVDVGYICKKCQMVYPVRDACLTHQRMACYTTGGHGGKTMLKLEQLQYECRVCCEKFSTLTEVKAHCQQDSHKVKVNKLGASVVPASTSASLRSSPKSATSSFALSSASQSHAAAHGGDRMSHAATSFSLSAKKSPSASGSHGADKDESKHPKLD